MEERWEREVGGGDGERRVGRERGEAEDLR